MDSKDECRRCEGCGQIANSDEGEPWTAWASLPPGSDLAVQLGMVKPIPCPDCCVEPADTTEQAEAEIGGKADG